MTPAEATQAQPVRLRLSRARGFDLQAHSRATNGLPAVNVARPGPWGNPFVVGIDGDRSVCVGLFANLLCSYVCITAKAPLADQETALRHVRANFSDLRNHNLACWCALDSKPCHGDVLLKYVALKCEAA